MVSTPAVWPCSGWPGVWLPQVRNALRSSSSEAEAAEVELDVQREARVAAGEHEAVAAGPVGVGRVVPHHLLEEQVGRRRQAHRRTGVAVADLLDRVHGQHPDRVDSATVEVGPVQGGVPSRGSSTVDRAIGGRPTAYPPTAGTTGCHCDPGAPGQRRKGAAGLDWSCPEPASADLFPDLREVVTAVDPHAGAAPATSPTGHGAAPSGWRDVVGAYVGLTKPRIIELLLVTTVPVMFLAERRGPGRVAGRRHRGRRHPVGRLGRTP